MTYSTNKMFFKDSTGDVMYKNSPDMEIFMCFVTQKLVRDPRAKQLRPHSLEKVCRAMKKFLGNGTASKGVLRMYHEQRVTAFLKKNTRRHRASVNRVLCM